MRPESENNSDFNNALEDFLAEAKQKKDSLSEVISQIISEAKEEGEELSEETAREIAKILALFDEVRSCMDQAVQGLAFRRMMMRSGQPFSMINMRDPGGRYEPKDPKKLAQRAQEIYKKEVEKKKGNESKKERKIFKTIIEKGVPLAKDLAILAEKAAELF